ncbi:MAG: hypothetical protein JJU02_03340 [Cryomorphaceae bacterium]|nr:hypothetical protein [Cryomorphaceae bacterium]
MRNLYVLLLFTFFAKCVLHAQCEKEISTDPDNPVNNEFLLLKNTWYSANAPYTVNSYLNTTINWKGGSNILLDLRPGWINPLFPAYNPPSSTQELFEMRSPFSTSHAASHLNPVSLDESYRDFHWEDGWELLWSNLGKFPNGDPVNNSSSGVFFEKNNDIENPKVFSPSPDHVPYFALYNRYTGMVRLFSNVWFDPLGSYYDDVLITFRSNPFDYGISGLFRTIGNYDEALDQPTKYHRMYSTRSDPKASRDWNISEFQVGFDPCICLRQKTNEDNGPGSLLFEFETFTNLDVNIVSRSSSVDVEQSNYDNGINPFLTLSDYNTDSYIPGYEIHRRVTSLFDDYQKKLEDYNTKLNDYNNPWNQAKWDLINVGKTFVSAGGVFTIPKWRCLHCYC